MRRHIVMAGLLVALSANGSTTSTHPASPVPPVPDIQIHEVIGELAFEENRGQMPEAASFVARGSGYNVVLGKSPTIELYRTQSDTNWGRKVASHVLSLDIQNAQGTQRFTPELEAPTKVHYLVGAASQWKTDIPTFRRVRQHDVLPDIDMLFYGRDGRLEYDFELAPGADVDDVRFRFHGADQLTVNEAGQLVIQLPSGRTMVQRPPVTFQVTDSGDRVAVASRYVLDGGWVGFDVSDYDTNRVLVIDPVLDYSAYYGGALEDRADAVGVDATDSIYVLSETRSLGLSTTGAFGSNNPTLARVASVSFPSCGDCTDGPPGGGQVERTLVGPGPVAALLVSKFSADGSTLLSATYLGSASGGLVRPGFNSFAVSPAGEVALGISSPAPDDLPLVSQTQAFDSGQVNAYVAKLNAAGNGLVFSTYLSLGPTGAIATWLRGIDVAPDGSVAAVGMLADNFSGSTASDIRFPQINPIAGQDCALDASSFDDVTDGWMILFSPTGTATFASCLGGSVRDGTILEGLRGVDIGANGHLNLLGYSSMTDFPTTVDSFQPVKSGAGIRDATVTVVDPATSQIVHATYYGPLQQGVAPNPANQTSATNFPISIDSDAAGNIVIAGSTTHVAMPTVNAHQPNLRYLDSPSPDVTGREFLRVDSDNYVAKFSPTLDGLVFSTYLGGSRGEGIAIMRSDAAGNTYLYTLSEADDYPLLNPIQAGKAGSISAAISKFTPAGALTFSSYLGGTDNRLLLKPGGLAINSMGDLILASTTESSDWPVTDGSTPVGDFDVALSIIDFSDVMDGDSDGVGDAFDAFPADPNEWLDTDSNGVGNNADDDDDGDMTLDVDDAFPLDATEQADSDLDGVGDAADVFPMDSANVFDADMNGLGDFTEEDADKDGYANSVDFRPFDATRFVDSDGDGIDDSVDMDDDGDGIDDDSDPFPTNWDAPVITFQRFQPTNTSVYKSPLPTGFSAVAGVDFAWTAASDQAFSDVTSLGSLPIGDGETASVQYTEFFEGGPISFAYRVDSEQDSDFLTFAVDGVELLSASGLVDWTTFSTTVTAGEHTLTWSYSKDASGSVGADAAWIDNLGGAPQIPVDLGVTIEGFEPILAGADTAQLTAIITNDSEVATVGSRFVLDFPPALQNVQWTCTNGAGAPCSSRLDPAGKRVAKTGSGIGDIDELLDLGRGETITFTIDTDVVPSSTPFSLSASVNAFPGVREEEVDNNVANVGVIFASGFESQ